ncbi:MAG: MlaD family protein, partial [Bacteroidales bacterium]
MPSARMMGVGAFVIGGLLLFAIALFMIGERQMLFMKQFEAYADFARLAGLEEGATVQVSGLAAGEVKEIVIPKSPGGKFRVRLQIREDLHPLVRTDSVASIRTQGLVGGQFVMVTAGTEQAPRVAAGGTIKSREPFDMADLLEQAAGTVKNVNETIATLRAEIENVIANVASTVQDADALINDVGGDVRAIASSGAKVADDISTITDDVRGGRGTIGQLFVNDDLYKRADAIAAEAQQAAANVKAASESAKKLLNEWSQPGGPAQGLTTEVRDT